MPAAFSALLLIAVTAVRSVTADGAGTTPTRGYGRYPCTVNADCTFLSPLTTCSLDSMSGFKFCGIYGSACSANKPTTSCDGGYCVRTSGATGTCTGTYGQTVPGTSPCLGSLGKNSAGVCGVVGSFCGTLNQHGSQSLNDAYDQNCQTNYCNTNTFLCGTRAGVGQSCASDPVRGCQAGLYPNVDATAGTCVCSTTPPPGPSSRARARARERRNLSSLCPRSYTACAVGSMGAYECIDTSSSLEQCGGCVADGGVDCTSLLGVSAVGCLEGRCEIWRCEEGWHFDAPSDSCVRD